ncbi:outer membrane protein [Bradyrhizobium arachidis]|nr:outer membrane beta-barrel protein [Bradyrhizobium arachidis]SFU61161.1 outer membrane immunogenic protein [Bradyrhizobium arachidis]
MTSSLPITTAILGVTAIVFAANASAADLPPYPHDAPVIRGAPVYGWQGAYVGVAGGGSWGRSKHVDRVTGLDDTPVFNVNGGVFGTTAGYNWQLMSWIFGAEGDLSWAGQKGSSLDSGPAGNVDFSSFTKLQWLGTLRGRIGYTPGNVLLYATAGYAAAGVEAGVKSSATGAVFDSASSWRSGWTAGAGAEWAFAPAWSAKVEYLYVKLEDGGFTTPNLGAAFDRSHVSFDDHIVRIGVNYYFSGLPIRHY